MHLHYLLVIIQFAGILYFALTGNVFPENILVFLFELSSVVIGLWAIVSMKLHTLTILPSVKQGGRLCVSGRLRRQHRSPARHG